MVSVAQLVRALGCGPSGRGFESLHSPHAPVAQLDRASDFESAGRPFEPGRARHFIAIPSIPFEKDSLELSLGRKYFAKLPATPKLLCSGWFAEGNLDRLKAKGGGKKIAPLLFFNDLKYLA